MYGALPAKIFLSTLSLRRATSFSHAIIILVLFLSTLSLRRATACQAWRGTQRHNFYPRSPCGERLPHRIRLEMACRNFYPRSPCGERPTHVNISTCKIAFLSTLSLRRATTIMLYDASALMISIHALLAESDRRRGFTCYLDNIDFYPRSPCGERRQQTRGLVPAQQISIHALLAESDGRLRILCIFITLFLSTLSLRRATFKNHFFICHHSLFLSTLSLRRATTENLS